MPKRSSFATCSNTDLPAGLLRKYQQVIFEKRHTDIFLHARAERLITELDSATFIICGAGVARGIVEAAGGLRNRHFSVICASDAVLDLDEAMSEMAHLRMMAKGVIFAPTKEIITPQLRRRPMQLRKSVHA